MKAKNRFKSLAVPKPYGGRDEASEMDLLRREETSFNFGDRSVAGAGARLSGRRPNAINYTAKPS